MKSRKKVCSRFLSQIAHLCTQEILGAEFFKYVLKERMLWSLVLENLLDASEYLS